VNISVYYDPAHPWNVPVIQNAMKAGLDYYQANYSPYQVRVLEFPAPQGSFAQSFANTIPWSEGIFFIADNRDPSRIDMATYVGAHELGHQWWAHHTLLSMKVFRQVVESGSFVGAAERLNLSTAMTSKHLMFLEKHLGSRLLNRSSRRLSLTESGKLYFERCKVIHRVRTAPSMNLTPESKSVSDSVGSNTIITKPLD
jgi:hypothetical protein